MRLLKKSGLNQRISWFHPQFVIYSDPVYYHCQHILAGYPGTNFTPEQSLFNQQISAARVSVEWAFGCVLRNGLRMVKAFRFWLQPVGLYYKVAVIVFIMRNSFYPNQISQYYNCPE